ncbi:hypothetical protein [Cupriavidus basilensis]|uniref:hypothetical protein n=1 Tax=Cupriavidus basilensis TaxID=68895 RepID=UPI0020A6A0D8|nr:hypothetical protein [Cupriavidus basilensis]MCP3017432.1 hypothetical protein [Cupriavidus basilensis]
MSVMIEQIFRTPQGAQISQLVKPSQIGVVPPEWRDCRLVKFHWPTCVWPGAYPLVYLTKDAGALCPECANTNVRLTLGADPQWEIVGSFINWEDPACYCDNCSQRVEPAYNTEEETTA